MIRDLTTLRLFVRAAETGTLSEASEHFHIAPATASLDTIDRREGCAEKQV